VDFPQRPLRHDNAILRSADRLIMRGIVLDARTDAALLQSGDEVGRDVAREGGIVGKGLEPASQ
jgi:hypothetical protein